MGTTKKNSDMDLHTAITITILDLKREGTVTALAKELEIPRNRLTLLIGACEGNNKEKQCWDLEPLIKIAKKIKVADNQISVSELIRVAEDVQKGLPPWFHARIAENADPQTRNELMHVFLEAAGCRTYAMEDPLGLKEKGKRKSFTHCKKNPLSGNMADTLDFFADLILKNNRLRFFVDAYQNGTITSEETYLILKNAFDKVIGRIDNVNDEAGAISLFKLLFEAKGKLTAEIGHKANRLIKKKESEQILGVE